jgi:hypothetical protein
MQTRNPGRNLATLLAAFLNIGTLTASLFLMPTASAAATPADKRKPGLYWTYSIFIQNAAKYTIVANFC